MKYLLAILILMLPVGVWAYSTATSGSLSSASSQYAWNTSPSGFTGGTSARTLSIWLKTSTAGGTAFSVGNDNGTAGLWRLGINGANVLINGTGGGNMQWTATNISDGNWHHVVMVHDGGDMNTTNTHAYMDGSALSRVAGTDPFAINTLTTFITVGGSVSSGSAGDFFNGQVEDARIWNRALSSGEVSSLYTAPCTFANGSSFLSWYLFESNWNDVNGTNNLTAVNSPTFSSSVPYTCPSFVPWMMSDF